MTDDLITDPDLDPTKPNPWPFRLWVGVTLVAAGFLHDRVQDPVTLAYLQDVDRTLLRENLRKSVSERVEALTALQRLAAEARGAAKRSRRRS